MKKLNCWMIKAVDLLLSATPPILSKMVAQRLKKETSRCRSLENYVNLAFTFSVGPLIHIRPIQVREEALQLLKLLVKMRPKVVLEIGTANGGTLFLFSRVSHPDAVIISVDLPRNKGGYAPWKTPFYRSFTSQNQDINLVRGDSHDPDTIERVKEILDGKPIDFIFIDGDHSYSGVKLDFQVYSKFVNDGLIALHDIVPRPPETGCEVNKFWIEIRSKYRHLEIVNDWLGWGGIGLIYMGHDV